MPAEPLVTVIIAAYNRSQVVRWAIESVRRQRWQNWQCVVVGDGCTDDTEDVVRGFGDARIDFVNLPVNSGGQSAPHNHALSRARGDYILYLNQDDLYFPDHIGRAVRFLQASGAEFAWCPVIAPQPKADGLPDLETQTVVIAAMSANGYFDPNGFYVSSCWAMPRATADRVGPWKDASETVLSPSQEWLYRAWKRGIVMRMRREVSVLCLSSASRLRSYAIRESPEHAYYHAVLYDTPQRIERLFERAAMQHEQMRLRAEQPTWRNLGEFAAGLLRRAVLASGFHPRTLEQVVRFGGRGGFVRWHRNRVMATPTLPGGCRIEPGRPEHEACFTNGWLPGEGSRRWTCQRRAEILLCAPAGHHELRLNGRPLVPQTVSFHVGDARHEHSFASRNETVVLPLPPSDGLPVIVRIEVAETGRPIDRNPDSRDERTLGFVLHWLELREPAEPR